MRTIYPNEIALQFLSRYKMHEVGEDYDYIFEVDQASAMLATIVKDPIEMVKFFQRVQSIIIHEIAIERGAENYLEIARVLTQWNNTVVSYLLPIMSMLNLPVEDRQEMVEEYEKLRALKDAQKYTQTKPDFKLSDIDDLIKQPEQGDGEPD